MYYWLGLMIITGAVGGLMCYWLGLINNGGVGVEIVGRLIHRVNAYSMVDLDQLRCQVVSRQVSNIKLGI